MRKLLLTAFALVALTFGAFVVTASPVSAVPGDGTADDVTGDALSEVSGVWNDVGVEHVASIWTIAAAFFAFFLAIGLITMAIRRTKRRLMGAASSGT